MAHIVVVYHSGYGHTKKQAIAVGAGAESVAGASVRLYSVENVDWDELNRADAIIFGAPTYMGSASAPFKAFMDESSKQYTSQKWKDKLAGGFTNSGSLSGDKLSTLNQFAVFAAQHGMIWVGLGLVGGNNSSKSSPNDLNRIGGWMGAMSQSNIDQGPDVAPSESDLKTANHLGERIALAAKRWKGEFSK
jgi:NAD(P)H dehydrogenase (quinone)